MPRFQAAVVCSQEDRQTAALQVAGNGAPIEVIVNGADTTFYQPVREPDAHPTVLILGTMHYYPNIDAVLHYMQTMHEALRAAIPDLQLLIVGHLPPPEIVALGNLPGVTVTGSVPDIRPYMARSWVQLVPLRLGGGTRLKIVESMAAGLPVLSTSVGAQGLGATDGQRAHACRRSGRLCAQGGDAAQQHRPARRDGGYGAQLCRGALQLAESGPALCGLLPDNGSARPRARAPTPAPLMHTITPTQRRKGAIPRRKGAKSQRKAKERLFLLLPFFAFLCAFAPLRRGLF